MSSIMDLLGGAGGPQGPDGGGPAGPPPPPPAHRGGGGGVPGKPDNPDAEQALSDVIDGLHAFLQAEQDDGDKAIAAKCLAQLQAIFGTRQKQHEAAAGITPAHKAMGRAMRQGGPPPVGAGAGY